MHCNLFCCWFWFVLLLVLVRFVVCRTYYFTTCLVFAELQKQNERLIGDLSKRDDSHTLLLQVRTNKTRVYIMCCLFVVVILFVIVKLFVIVCCGIVVCELFYVVVFFVCLLCLSYCIVVALLFVIACSCMVDCLLICVESIGSCSLLRRYFVLFFIFVLCFSAKVCFAAAGVAVARGAEPNVHEAGRPQKTDPNAENTAHAFGKNILVSSLFVF